MNKTLLKGLKFLLFFLLIFDFVNAQNAPFYSEIQQFKTQDSIRFPPKNAILFLGSSSFRKWDDVQKYFPGYKIINRGFGGSSLPDVIRYANDIIFPYHPQEIVIYCGENDFAGSDAPSAQTVVDRFKTLYGMIRAKMKDVPVVYVSIKPSPSRRNYRTKMIEANKEIKAYLATQQHATFVDVFDLMLNQNNQPKPEIFESDSLHMNAKGYAIWQKAIQPHLIK